MSRIRRGSVFSAIVLILLAFTGCGRSEYQEIAGPTMGTQFRLQARCGDVLERSAVETVLDEIVDTMSTYDPRSWISTFNAAPVDTWVDVPAGVAEVLAVAQSLHERSRGAFDVTVGALVNTWGFGPTVVDDALPGSAAIAASRQRVGFRKLQFDAGRLRKRADVYVDLSAIAKGYAVDRLAALLAESRCGDFLVDVGGEMRVGGVNPLGTAWRIGIEVPRREGLREAQRILRLSNEAIATSGDYRNYREVGGKYVSHLIDPRKGAPVEHALASVSVIHPSAMWADGYATTIGVLGPEAGLEFANLHEIDVLMIVRIPFGFEELLSDTMRERLAPRPTDAPGRGQSSD